MLPPLSRRVFVTVSQSLGIFRVEGEQVQMRQATAPAPSRHPHSRRRLALASERELQPMSPSFPLRSILLQPPDLHSFASRAILILS